MNVHYRIKGAGFPVVLIHGTASSLHTWDRWTEVLSEEFTVYLLDLPGCGLTGPHPNQDYSIDSYLSLVREFTAHHQLDSFHLAGNSLGGHIAWELARQGAPVGKLILVDPSGIEDAVDALVVRLGRSGIITSVVEYLNVSMLVNSSLNEVYYSRERILPETRQRYQELIRRKGNRKAFARMVSVNRSANPEQLKEISCPTLLMWGRQDLWIPVETARVFTENIPDNELLVYDNCGHVPQEELPFITAEDALDFLQSSLR